MRVQLYKDDHYKVIYDSEANKFKIFDAASNAILMSKHIFEIIAILLMKDD
jgi:hypothetical protein